MDPLTLAAITGGFAAVKSAVQGVRTALNTAEDVGAIAGQIDRLFKTHGEAKKRIVSASKNKNLPNNKVSVKWDDNKRPLDDINTIIVTIDGKEYPKRFNFKKGSNEYYQWLEETVNKIRAANDAKTKKGMRGGEDKDYGG